MRRDAVSDDRGKESQADGKRGKAGSELVLLHSGAGSAGFKRQYRNWIYVLLHLFEYKLNVSMILKFLVVLGNYW